MKQILGVLIIILFFSCSKEKYTKDGLFLEDLKEISNVYKGLCSETSAKIENMYADRGRHSGKFDTLNLITKRLDTLFVKMESKGKKVMLQLLQKEVKTINSLHSTYKLKAIDPSKLEILDGDLLFYYLKNQLYQNQFYHYKSHLDHIGIYCGMRVLSEKQVELIEAIRNSDIK